MSTFLLGALILYLQYSTLKGLNTLYLELYKKLNGLEEEIRQRIGVVESAVWRAAEGKKRK